MRLLFVLMMASTIVVLFLLKIDQEFQPDDLAKLQQQARSMTERNVPNEFTTDACTMFPNKIDGIDLTDICIEHDMAYWAGGTEEQRRMADIKMRKAVSEKSKFLGEIMYFLSRITGNAKCPFPQKWGYGYL